MQASSKARTNAALLARTTEGMACSLISIRVLKVLSAEVEVLVCNRILTCFHALCCRRFKYRHASVILAADKHSSFGFVHCLLPLHCTSCTDQVPHQAKRIAATGTTTSYPAEACMRVQKSFIAASPPVGLRCCVQVVSSLVQVCLAASSSAEPSVHPCNAVSSVRQPAAAPLRTATLCAAASLPPHQCSPPSTAFSSPTQQQSRRSPARSTVPSGTLQHCRDPRRQQHHAVCLPRGAGAA